MKKYAESWWLNKGQYYDQDSDLYPKIPIIDAFMAGFDAGRVIGKNEALENGNPERKSLAEFVVKNIG